MNVVPLTSRITLRVEIIHLKSAIIYLLKKTASYELAKLEVQKKQLDNIWIQGYVLLSKILLRVS